METFSKQLERLYQRNISLSDGKLQPITNPIKRNLSIAWITTPIAACIGLIIGLSIHHHFDSDVSSRYMQTKVAASISLPEYCYSINQYKTIQLSEICITPQN